MRLCQPASGHRGLPDEPLTRSDSRDATGRNRTQIIDSNWLVVGQTPAPGTSLASGDIPMLDVVKFGEAVCR